MSSHRFVSSVASREIKSREMSFITIAVINYETDLDAHARRHLCARPTVFLNCEIISTGTTGVIYCLFGLFGRPLLSSFASSCKSNDFSGS